MTTATANPTKETVAALPAPKYVFIDVGLIQESKANPRKHFDPKRIEEFAKSMKQQGVLEPLIIRPVEEKDAPYELVAGARRLRAARKAGLTEVPCLIRELTDAQALEIMVMENLERQELHPTEEAGGFRALMKEAGWKVQDLAEKTGKSVSEIYATLKLLDLIEPASAAFLQDKIDEGHAVEIARLDPRTQKEALDVCTAKGDDGETYKLTVRDLKAWIAREVHLKLSGAPWKKDDAALVVKAGACATCPKRAGNSPELHPDVKDPNTCTDRTCYQEKLRAWLELQRQELVKAGKKAKLITREFESSKGITGRDNYHELERGADDGDCVGVGVVADASGLGQRLKVCFAKHGECRKPGHGWVSVPVRRSGSASKSSPQAAAANRREAKANEQRIIKERATARARLAIYEQIIRRTNSLTRRDLDLLADRSDGLPYLEGKKPDWLPPRTGGLHNFAKLSDKDLAKYLIAAALERELGTYGNAQHLYATAARHKLDVTKIEKDAVRQVAHERMHHQRRMAWKGRAAAGNTRFEILTCQGCGRTEKDQSKGGFHWVRKNDKSKLAFCNDCEHEEATGV